MKTYIQRLSHITCELKNKADNCQDEELRDIIEYLDGVIEDMHREVSP